MPEPDCPAMSPLSGMPGRPLLAEAVPPEPDVVEADGKELEPDPADDVARPLEKSGNPADAAEEPCWRPPLADGIDGIPPDDDDDEADGMDGIDEELEELDDELDEELEDELDDGIDGMDDDDGIAGGGMLLD